MGDKYSIYLITAQERRERRGPCIKTSTHGFRGYKINDIGLNINNQLLMLCFDWVLKGISLHRIFSIDYRI